MDVPGNTLCVGADAARVEDQLASTLADMCDDIARADSLESEERAEVYTILEIIRTETARHRKVFGRYVSDGGTGDA